MQAVFPVNPFLPIKNLSFQRVPLYTRQFKKKASVEAFFRVIGTLISPLLLFFAFFN